MAHGDGARNPFVLPPVIVAVVLLAAAAVSTIGCADRSEERVIAVDGTAGNGAESGSADRTESPLQEYVQFAAAAAAAGPQAETLYMADGLRKLAGALGSLRVGTPELHVDLRVAAEQILLNPASTSAIVRMALISVAAAIAGRHGDDVDNLRRLAESIRPGRPILDERVTIEQFFQHSANVLSRL